MVEKSSPKKGNKVIGFVYHDIGASKMRSYEDRGVFTSLKTRSGLEIYVGIVADGVGGGNLGQRAAELTIQSILEFLAHATGGPEDIPQMMGRAIGYANRKVYMESRESPQKRGMSSTVAMALIHNKRLYVANVGDSRVYLVRDGIARQITVDHTYANEKIRQGILTPEKAYQHPNAEALTRSVGFEAQIIVDLGLYLTGNERGKEALKNQGLLLKEDDVVVICSDGLIKSLPDQEDRHFVEPEEIALTVQQYHAEEAAKVLIDLALGRNVDDNVTAVVMEFPGRKVKRKFLQPNSLRVGAVTLITLFVAVTLWFRLTHAKEQLTALEQQSTAQAQTAIAMTAIVASYTPTPTNTPRPPLEPGEIGRVNGQVIFADQPISLSLGAIAYINHDTTSPLNGIVVSLVDTSQILFNAPPDQVMAFVLFPNSQIFVENGRYVESRILLSEANIEFRVAGSCLLLDYTVPNQITAACYEGQCSYQVNFQERQSIGIGREIVLNIRNGGIVIKERSISVQGVWQLWNILHDKLSSQTNILSCVQRWIPTPQPTQIIISKNTGQHHSGHSKSTEQVTTDDNDDGSGDDGSDDGSGDDGSDDGSGDDGSDDGSGDGGSDDGSGDDGSDDGSGDDGGDEVEEG